MNGEFLVRTPVPTDRANIVQRGRILQYLTIAWNSLECVIALVAGFLAGSIALIGFGFDSAIEVTSSLAALWRLRQDRDEETDRKSTRLNSSHNQKSHAAFFFKKKKIHNHKYYTK